MPTAGDVVDLDLGLSEGREAAFRRPAVVVTAQRILNAEPPVVHVVALGSTIRSFHSELTIEPDAHNGLASVSATQCQHLRAVSPERISSTRCNVRAARLAQIRETISVILSRNTRMSAAERVAHCRADLA